MNPAFSKLRPHQPAHVELLLGCLQRRGAVLDRSETGTGKTHCALVAAKLLDTVPIVIGPKAARMGWEDAGKIQGVDFEYVNYELARTVKLTDAEKRRRDEWVKANKELISKIRALPQPEDAKPPTPEKIWLEAHPEVWRTVQTEWLTEHKHGQGSYLKWKNNYDLMIFDEVHRCASVGPTLNRKMLIAAKRQAGKLLTLSATAAESPLQMCALGYALGLHTLSKQSPMGKTTWMDFLWRYYCKPGVFGGFNWTDDPEEQRDAMLRLNARLSDRSAGMKKAEIPGFPKNQIEVMLLEDESGKARELVERLHEIYTHRKTQAAEAAAKSNAMVEGIREKQALEILMVPALANLAVDYVRTSRVIFFVTYRQTREELVFALEKAGLNTAFIDGTNTEEERRDILRRFARDQIETLVVNSFAGGESLNLQGPMPRTTFILPVESGRQAEQITGRAHRDGGADALQFFCYFAGTRQEVVANRMRAKQMNLKLLNDGDYQL